jgi:hypothetical protein
MSPRRELIDAGIEGTVAGAIWVLGIATPVPIWMRLVLTAASASVAQQSDQTSGNQAPSRSAAEMEAPTSTFGASGDATTPMVAKFVDNAEISLPCEWVDEACASIRTIHVLLTDLYIKTDFYEGLQSP